MVFLSDIFMIRSGYLGCKMIFEALFLTMNVSFSRLNGVVLFSQFGYSNFSSIPTEIREKNFNEAKNQENDTFIVRNKASNIILYPK